MGEWMVGVEVEGDGALTGGEGRLLDFGVEPSTSAGEAGTDCDLALTNSTSFLLRPAHFSVSMGISSSSSSLVLFKDERRGGGLSSTSISASGLGPLLVYCCA